MDGMVVRGVVRGFLFSLISARGVRPFAPTFTRPLSLTAASGQNSVDWLNSKRTTLRQAKDVIVSKHQTSSNKSDAGSNNVTPVIFDHDGGLDDLIALVVLASAHAAVPKNTYAKNNGQQKEEEPASSTRCQEKVKLLGVTIVEASTYVEPCIEGCRRLLALYGDVCLELAQIPVAASPLQGAACPFPDNWRKSVYVLKDFPILNTPFVNRIVASSRSKPDHREHDGHELLGELVVNHKKKNSVSSSSPGITLVVTGPLSNVAYALTKHGRAFTDNIDRIIIMGGAGKVEGNVFQKDLTPVLQNSSNNAEAAVVVDGSAKWNIYWDAPSTKKVIEHPDLAGKLFLFALDATNGVPVTSELVKRFGEECYDDCGGTTTTSSEKQQQQWKKNPSALAQFVGNAWAQVAHSEWAFAWDVLTAAYVVDPTIVLEKSLSCVTVEARLGHPSEGRTIVHENNDDDKSGIKTRRPNVHVIMKADKEQFYQAAVNATKSI